MEKELVIKNDISQISVLAEFIESMGEECEFSLSLIMSINLALEEAISNIILYAYPEKMGEEISIKVSLRDRLLVFTIADSGMEFDPTIVPDADISLSVEDRKIGGLGIYLVRKIMDEVTYKRIENKNILTIKKEI